MIKTIFINGREITCDDSQCVLEIAKENNIYIPSICYHPRLGHVRGDERQTQNHKQHDELSNKCRMCLVEVEGMAGLQTSCDLFPTDGMTLRTDTANILDAQGSRVRELLSNGHHNCITCERNGDCELQDAAYHLGIDEPAYIIKEPREIDDSAAFIIRDNNKCVQCGRCIVGCNNLVGHEVLDFRVIDGKTKVVCDFNTPMGESSCVQCGECVQLCPVGALIEKKSVGKARRWETEAIRTTCPYCGVGCQLELHVKDEQIVRITGVEHAQPNQGHLCVKGRYGYDFIYSKDRLTSPLIKNSKGEFQEASWGEALDLVAKKFKQIIKESGPDAIAGVSCARSTNEDSYNMQKLFRSVIGTNNIDHCART